MSSPTPATSSPPPSSSNLSESDADLEELQRAVLEIPDSDDGQLGGEEEAIEILSTATTDWDPSSPSPAAPIQDLPPGSGPLVGSGPQGEWELSDWLRASEQGLGAASSASSAGFSVARGVTSFGLTMAKRFTQLAVALPALLIDSANGSVPGSEQATFGALAHSSVGGFYDLISTLALGGIDIGSALTSAGLGAASSGVEGTRRALGSEVTRSLGQFAQLVKREWNAQGGFLPPGGLPPFGLTGVTRALLVWICIQMVTRREYEKGMLKELGEIDAVAMRKEIEHEHEQERQRTARLNSVRITAASVGPNGEVIGAEVGAGSADESSTTTSPTATSVAPLTDREAMAGLLRYSSLVLAVYGGTALAWLGALPKEQADAARVPRPTPASQGLRDNGPLPADGLTREQDEEQFLRAAAMMDLTETEREEEERRFARAGNRPMVDSSGQVIFDAGDVPGAFTPRAAAPGTPGSSAAADPSTSTTTASAAPNTATTTSAYTYLGLLSGEHDEELFHRVSQLDPEHVRPGSYQPHRDDPPEQPRPAGSVARPSQPRYYIVTDHKAQKVVLVLRGSLSLGDIAADLTCESREFTFPGSKEEASATAATSAAGVPFPATDASTSMHNSAAQPEPARHVVHEGMFETSLLVGSPGAPVHRAVRLALEASPSYSLDITGHSLGGGVASILAILWADPKTCLTTSASGLPAGRRLHAYCYGCPATMSRELGDMTTALITTYAYSYDLVCRLSLGSILDIRNASAWILYEDQEAQRRAASTPQQDQRGFDPSDRSTPMRVATVMRRAFEHQAGRLDGDPEAKAEMERDFLALRRTLEANMHNVHLYPPGQVVYLFREGDLLQSHFETEIAAPVSEETAVPAPSVAKATDRQRAFMLRGRRDKVFDQIVMSRKLLSCHMPQHYDLALRGLE
ncbi:hypothetical protein BDZ90DRAFT_229729 [Jaminaea rosea]|uniref:sn-1-specific diacylglycerol lipase n=1 Tax=Jaminaea rosea TaxID=1569628 RepID=A0A316UZL2_9BASI|nr:hypothetical protein BDZ90DRAFT_229729 [Jaminaea rosea]PWN30726.1 hypothetical protein BDZ90DRAFT_229729 [Jaminaea rosea]